MSINLTYPCLLFIIITLCLFNISKTKDKYLLGIMLIGQFLLLFGSIFKNNIIIEIAHIIFTITVIIGVFIFQELHNRLYILIVLFLILFSRYYFNDCLFRLANNNIKIINININYDIIFLLLLIITIYKLTFKELLYIRLL